MTARVLILPGHGLDNEGDPDDGHTTAAGRLTEWQAAAQTAVRLQDRIHDQLGGVDVVQATAITSRMSPLGKVQYARGDTYNLVVELHYGPPEQANDPTVYWGQGHDEQVAVLLAACLQSAGYPGASIVQDASIDLLTDLGCAACVIVLPALGSLGAVAELDIIDALSSGILSQLGYATSAAPWPETGPAFLVMTGELDAPEGAQPTMEPFDDLELALGHARASLSASGPAGRFATITSTQPTV